MKIRQGFVSNSSSSSFVIIGYDISDWDTKDLPICYPICVLCGEDDGLDDGEAIIGVRYAWEDDDGIYKKDMASILKDLDKVTAVIGQDRKLQIYYGTY